MDKFDKFEAYIGMMKPIFKHMHVSDEGDHGEVPHSELAMHGKIAGKKIKRYAIGYRDDGHPSSAYIKTHDNDIDHGLPSEVLPHEIHSKLTKLNTDAKPESRNESRGIMDKRTVKDLLNEWGIDESIGHQKSEQPKDQYFTEPVPDVKETGAGNGDSKEIGKGKAMLDFPKSDTRKALDKLTAAHNAEIEAEEAPKKDAIRKAREEKYSKTGDIKDHPNYYGKNDGRHITSESNIDSKDFSYLEQEIPVIDPRMFEDRRDTTSIHEYINFPIMENDINESEKMSIQQAQASGLKHAGGGYWRNKEGYVTHKTNRDTGMLSPTPFKVHHHHLNDFLHAQKTVATKKAAEKKEAEKKAAENKPEQKAPEAQASAEPQHSQEDLDKKLFDAVGEGDHESVKKHLKAGANPNARVDGEYAFHHAIMHGDHDDDSMANVFLEHGKGLKHSLRTKGGGTTSLHIAASQGKHRIAKKLREMGADPHAKDLGDDEMKIAPKSAHDVAKEHAALGHKGAKETLEALS